MDGRCWRAEFACGDAAPSKDLTRELRPTASEFATWLADAYDRGVLRAMACELAGGVPARNEADVVARLVQATRSGRVRFFERPLSLRPLDRRVDVKTVEGGPPEAHAIEEDLHHWIEIELLDECDCGIPAQRCVIATPDGQVHSRHTDSLGYIRMDRISGGMCKVSFPDLDASAWVTVAANP